MRDPAGTETGTGGFSFGGLKVAATGGVDAISAHAGAGGSITINDNTGTVKVKESADLGLGIGAKVHVDVQVPVRTVINAISSFVSSF